MVAALVVYVGLHDDRYHGAGEWPPSPARLFQALLAGAGISGPLTTDDARALEWLEGLPPPVIGAPPVVDGRAVTMYMPNNDLDAVGGDPARIALIRSARKVIKPRILVSRLPLFYAWIHGASARDHQIADHVGSLAARLYQFGRGVDFAWAWHEGLKLEQLDAFVNEYTGSIHRPAVGAGATVLRCPTSGSYESLKQRYHTSATRFVLLRRGRRVTTLFRRPLQPTFAEVPYDGEPHRQTFELRECSHVSMFATWPLVSVARLVEVVRDSALRRLKEAMPDFQREIERLFVGSGPEGGPVASPFDRLKIVPIPSIGHAYADEAIRRVLVEVPPGSPIPAEDILWAFSGLECENVLLSKPAAGANRMLQNYGVGGKGGGKCWRSITPVVLPEYGKGSPHSENKEQKKLKTGAEYRSELLGAAFAVRQALRHAGIRTRVAAVQVQREPFSANGEIANAFATGTRFASQRMWHTKIEFVEPVPGPIVLGDGRFLGLGLMAPTRETRVG